VAPAEVLVAWRRIAGEAAAVRQTHLPWEAVRQTHLPWEAVEAVRQTHLPWEAVEAVRRSHPPWEAAAVPCQVQAVRPASPVRRGLAEEAALDPAAPEAA